MTSSIEASARAARAADLLLQKRLAEMYARAVIDVTRAEQALARDIARRKAAGEPIKPTWLNQQSRYLELQQQYYRQLNSFGQDAVRLLQGRIPLELKTTLDMTLDEVRSQTGVGYNTAHWSQANKYALATANAMLEHDMSPLRQLLVRDFAETGLAQFRNTWTRGLTLGHNPNRIAAASRRAIADLTLGRAQMIARTEFHRAYREGNRAQWADSPIIEGWVWRAALDLRTCAVCWGMHGTRHKKSETLEGHPSCRCIMVPITDTEIGDLRTDRLGTGEAAFSRLPADMQRRILGPGRFKMYQQGNSLGSMIGRRESPLWGGMRVLEPIRGGPPPSRPPTTGPGPERRGSGSEIATMSEAQWTDYVRTRYGTELMGTPLPLSARQHIDDAFEAYLLRGINIREMPSMGYLHNTGAPDLGAHPLQPGARVPAHYDTGFNAVELSERALALRLKTRGYGVYDGHDGFTALMQHEIGHAVHHSLSSALRKRWDAIHYGTGGGTAARTITKQLNRTIQLRAQAKRDRDRWIERSNDPGETLSPEYIQRRIDTHAEMYDRYTVTIDTLRAAKKGMTPSGDVYPSSYGKNNPNEDFAETMWRYLNTPEWLAANAPQRYAFMREVFPG
jgi:SPP1 gp7 family putative phage head morphogenesis protein